MKRITGEFVPGSLHGVPYHAFVPRPLPPDPPLKWTPELEVLRDKANRALGRLDSIITLLPDADLFLYQYVRKEAVLSSQIEGTQSSLSDLLLFEMDETPGVPIDDVTEVSNYIASLRHGLERVKSGELPVCLRLLKEMHAILLKSGRGRRKEPGQFRRSQVWLGGRNPQEAEFVPPPPDRLRQSLDALERYLNDDAAQTPVLVKAALAHVQFETIHPFEDGNGRLGRLLITLLLCAEQTLREPILYLSLYFKQHRQEYYDRLQRVRTEGDWEGWLGFFLRGLEQTAQAAVDAAERLLALFRDDRDRLQALGRSAGSAIRIHQLLQEFPIITAPDAEQRLRISATTANNALKRLETLGVVREITGKQRYRAYAYTKYLDILSEGTEPIDR